MIKKASAHSKPAKRSKRKRPAVTSGTLTKTDRELSALLVNTNERALSKAKLRLERAMVLGIRHFSAVRRSVPLHLVDEASQEIVALEREVDPSEIFSNQPPRKWQKRKLSE